MDAILICDASAKLKVSHERFFAMAFNYYEVRVSRKYIIEVFLDWYHSNKMHSVVEDFVLQVLSGRVTR